MKVTFKATYIQSSSDYNHEGKVCAHCVRISSLCIKNVLLLVAGKYPREIMNSITNLCIQYTVGLVSSISDGGGAAAYSQQ
jgi:hypothetical protein